MNLSLSHLPLQEHRGDIHADLSPVLSLGLGYPTPGVVVDTAPTLDTQAALSLRQIINSLHRPRVVATRPNGVFAELLGLGRWFPVELPFLVLLGTMSRQCEEVLGLVLGLSSVFGDT